MDSRPFIRNCITRSCLTRSCLIGLVLALVALSAAIPAAAAPGDRSPDGVWIELEDDVVPQASLSLRFQAGEVPRRYGLDDAALLRILEAAPREFLPGSRAEAPILMLPLPEGGYARFRVQESPIVAGRLAIEHPEYSTFIAQGVDEPAAGGRLDRTPSGFHAMILSPSGTLFIDPARRGDSVNYVSYRRDQLVSPDAPFVCHVPSRGAVAPSAVPRLFGAPEIELRTYRLAMACTGEYTDFFGGVAEATDAIVTTVNRVNGIYEMEQAIRLNLVATVVYDDPGTDPFTDPSSVDGDLLDESDDALDDEVGEDEYDIGHLVGASGGGGLAQLGCVCGGDAGRAATSLNNPQGDAFDVDYVAHEMGHQFDGEHTFNGTTSNCGGGNREDDSAYEPGSGSTIMAYAGICGAEDVQPHSDPYFHTRSFDQIQSFREDDGDCGPATATGNTRPTVDAGADFKIPRDTPFTLTATGSDPDGDALTFCWEQFDLGDESPPFDGSVDGPLFRSRNPTTSPSRTFPPLTAIAGLIPSPWEVLPTVDRELNFRCTVRDNRAGGGGVHYDAMVVAVEGDPFRVTTPNGGEALHAGCTTTVTWDPGDGQADNVNILFSSNNGVSFLVTLASNTANDGSEVVEVPCTVTALARVKIEAVGNIFFDTSDANFQVVNDAPVIVVDAVGGEVDENCSFDVPFSAIITDDCEVDPASIAVTAENPSGNATLGTPVYEVDVVSLTEVEVTGTVLVSDLTSCPARVVVRVAASDACGVRSSDEQEVEVVDGTPPEIAIAPSREFLWPPNHRLVDIHVEVTATDNCPGVTYVLASIASNEPEDGLGDGDTAPDIVGADYDTADQDFQLRSERSGKAEGRIYTITYTATDGCGNSTDAVTAVRVMHDQAGHAIAMLGLTPEGDGIDSAAPVVVLVVPSLALAPDGDSAAEGLAGSLPVVGTGGGDTDVVDAGEGESLLLAFDARRIRPASVQAGNTGSVVSVLRVSTLDLTGDGIPDAIFVFPAAPLRAIEDGPVEDGPVGIHFTNRLGESFLIPDLLALGSGAGATLTPDAMERIATLVDLGSLTVQEPVNETVTTAQPVGGHDAQVPAGSSSVRGGSTALLSARPTPFAHTATIAFELAREARVRIGVFDVRGALVRTLLDDVVAAGSRSTSWNGFDAAGRRVPAGLYFVTFEGDGVRSTLRIVLAR